MKGKKNFVYHVFCSVLVVSVLLGTIHGTFVTADTGDWTVTTIGSTKEGYKDGNATTAEFTSTTGIAIDSKGDVFVADPENHVIRKIDSNGDVSTFLGDAITGKLGVSWDTEPIDFEPTLIAIDRQDNVYVFNEDSSDFYRVSPLKEITFVGSAMGSGKIAGMAVDYGGNIWFSYADNHTIERVSPDGTVTLVFGSNGESGNSDGFNEDIKFSSPRGIAIGPDGHLYIVDQENFSIRKLNTTTFEVTTIAGNDDWYNTDGDALTEAVFESAWGITIAPDGTMYVSQMDGTIRKIKDRIVTTILGQYKANGHLDGVNLQTKFHFPLYLVASDNNTLYISDFFNNAIRKAVYKSKDVTGITIQNKLDQLLIGDTYSLNTIVHSSSNRNQKIEYSTNDSNVASINEKGVITAIGPGNVRIIARTEDGGFTDSFQLIVMDKIAKATDPTVISPQVPPLDPVVPLPAINQSPMDNSSTTNNPTISSSTSSSIYPYPTIIPSLFDSSTIQVTDKPQVVQDTTEQEEPNTDDLEQKSIAMSKNEQQTDSNSSQVKTPKQTTTDTVVIKPEENKMPAGPSSVKPSKDSLPKTGESFPVSYIFGFVLMILGGIVLLFLRKKGKHNVAKHNA